MTAEPPVSKPVIVSKHAAIRYLERKVGYSKREITTELISGAMIELLEYFQQSVKKPTLRNGGLDEVYRHEDFEIDFFVRDNTIVTCVPSSWKEVRKPSHIPKKDGFRTRKAAWRRSRRNRLDKNNLKNYYEDELND